MNEEESSELSSTPQKKQRSWFGARFSAFGYAFKGIWYGLKTQPHVRIHIVAALVALAMGFLCQISSGEWIAVLLCIGAVLAAEYFNTALELLADSVSTDHHPLIGYAKDVAAGAVLVLAIISVVIGGIIFIPYVFP